MIFLRKAGKSKHMKICKASGHFERNDIQVFICKQCGFVAKSAGGLRQHMEQSSTCKEKSLSTLELSVTNVSPTIANFEIIFHIEIIDTFEIIFNFEVIFIFEMILIEDFHS